jgi:hypothetical protein
MLRVQLQLPLALQPGGNRRPGSQQLELVVSKQDQVVHVAGVPGNL